MPSRPALSIRSWLSHQLRVRRYDETLRFATSAKPESSGISRLVSGVDRGVGTLEGPPDGDRVELASEALVGAKWLLMLASQALEGSQTLRKEARDIQREYGAVSGLCDALSAPGLHVDRNENPAR